MKKNEELGVICIEIPVCGSPSLREIRDNLLPLIKVQCDIGPRILVKFHILFCWRISDFYIKVLRYDIEKRKLSFYQNSSSFS